MSVHMPFLTLLQVASLELKRIRIPPLRIMSIFISLFRKNINPLITTSNQKKSTSVSAELLLWNRTATAPNVPKSRGCGLHGE